MKKYTVQYSIPGNKLAVSDWIEYKTVIKAKNSAEAIKMFEKNRNGTWLILDCWEKESD